MPRLYALAYRLTQPTNSQESIVMDPLYVENGFRRENPFNDHVDFTSEGSFS